MGRKKKRNQGILLIKKSNNLIESRYNFNIWETRFFHSVLAQIRRDDEELQVYRVRYRDVINVFGLKSGDSYRYLRDAAKSLMAKSFYVNYEENGTKREKQYHILRHIDYLTEGQNSTATENDEYIDVTVEHMMKPFLIQLQKNFTTYDIRNLVGLGVYATRIYELIKQYLTIGRRTIRLDEMKRMFELEEEYKRFNDFYRYVIAPAEKQINKHTDISIVGIERTKEGRKIVALTFYFQKKSKDALRKLRGEPQARQLDLSIASTTESIEYEVVDEVNEKKVQNQLFQEYYKDIVVRFGVTPTVLMGLLKNHSIDAIKQAVEVTNRAKYNQQIKISTAGFFVRALKDGYTDEKIELKKKKQEEDQNQIKLEGIKKKIAQLEYEKAIAINDKIKEVTDYDKSVTSNAISLLKNDASIKKYIANKETMLERKLEIDDYRFDARLREMVKGKIVELKSGEFEGIIDYYDSEIKKKQKVK